VELNKKAIQIAAQCWQDKETQWITMDDRLCRAFAERLSPYIDKVDWYEAPEHVRHTARMYASLSLENKHKIDKLMAVLIEIGNPNQTDTGDKK